jgi:hypothetical protein
LIDIINQNFFIGTFLSRILKFPYQKTAITINIDMVLDSGDENGA